ncbi:MAG: signal peptidase I [Flavobacteriales bacterium]|jgi:hypothetical protein|nr:signal peptidase I [Flavobacteriales bacterium]MBT6808505.1 signal peptidase I [Flavobacteriales bacterium]
MSIIFLIALVVLLIISGWKVFEKAGHPGWASIVPIYNMIIMCRIAKKPEWWVILMFIPLVNYVVGIWIINRMVKGFGKSEGFTIGMIFLGFIFYPILAFGDADYDGNRLD